MHRIFRVLFAVCMLVCGVISHYAEYNSTLHHEKEHTHRCIHDTVLSQQEPTLLPANNGQDYGPEGRR